MDKKQRYFHFITQCLLVLLSLNISLFAKSNEAFYNDYVYLTPLSINTFSESLPLDIFQNPALLSLQESSSIALNIAEETWDYQEIFLCGSWNHPSIKIGYSVAQELSDQIPETSAPTPLDKPQILNYKKHKTHQISLTGIFTQFLFNPTIKISYLKQQLMHEQAQSFQIDLAAFHQFNSRLSLSAFTRYLNSAPLKWKSSQLKETRQPELILESAYQFEKFRARISSNATWMKLALSQQYHQLHFFIEYATKFKKENNRNHLQRLSFGSQLKWRTIDIFYYYHYYPHSQLKAKKSQLSFIWRWPLLT